MAIPTIDDDDPFLELSVTSLSMMRDAITPDRLNHPDLKYRCWAINKRDQLDAQKRDMQCQKN